MEYYPTVKRTNLLTRRNTDESSDTMLRASNLTQNITYCMVPLLWNSEKKTNPKLLYSDIKEICDLEGMGREGGDRKGTGKISWGGRMEMCFRGDGGHGRMTIVKAQTLQVTPVSFHCLSYTLVKVKTIVFYSCIHSQLFIQKGFSTHPNKSPVLSPHEKRADR